MGLKVLFLRCGDQKGINLFETRADKGSKAY